MGFVFQNYALFPHMKIFDNVAYGLRIRKESSDVIAQKVKEALGYGRLEKPSIATLISFQAVSNSVSL